MARIGVTRNTSGLSKWVFSTGVEDLDRLLGGGIERQGIYLIKNDRYAGYGKLLMDMFLSTGLEECNNLYVVSMDSDWKDMVKYLIGKSMSNKIESEKFDEGVQTPRIAWRYSELRNKNQVPKKKVRNPDISTRVSRDTLKDARERIAGIDLDRIKELPDNLKMNEILISIQNVLGKWSNLDSESSYRQTRVCIDNLGGPLWAGWKNFLKGDYSHIIEFLMGIQAILRMYPFACACVTIPSQYYTCEELSNLLYLCNTTINITSFLDDYPMNRLSYSDLYDGFITIEQGRKSGWESLGFKVHKGGISIKTLTIPPDESSDASRVINRSNNIKELF